VCRSKPAYLPSCIFFETGEQKEHREEWVDIEAFFQTYWLEQLRHCREILISRSKLLFPQSKEEAEEKM